MNTLTSYFTGLKCRECGKTYPKEIQYVCEYCFGPLEIEYDYDKIKTKLSKELILSRPASMWRYRELLPVEYEPTVGVHVGYTPLIRADRLAQKLGIREIWIKNDTVACASTGNLANSLAANAANAGLTSYVFIPDDLERGKVVGSLVYGANVIGIDGTYDRVNRLCSEIAGSFDWAFVNVNFRPYYAEGSKTVGFEIAEQLGWKLPDHVVVPMAGGSLINKVFKAFEEFKKLRFIPENQTKIHGAQAEGCSPIVNALKNGSNVIQPVEKPKTIVKSLAIGDPADGFYALETINKTGGYGENPDDKEVIEGIKLLAENEGIFSETAGGVVVGAAKRLIDSGKIGRDESVVLCITGNGLKTREVVDDLESKMLTIEPNLECFKELLDKNQIMKGALQSCR